MTITKTETRTVFDRSKIGKGDVIEFTELGFRNSRNPNSHRISTKTVGVVKYVHDEDVVVYARSQSEKWETNHVTEVSVPIGLADTIQVIHRHPANEN
ncbi:hypothetical protein P9480_10060 [Bacillus atrophaeus]|uniref:hypothetical protein n=1 Tax=Bacillus atrophaeus TaxID=1452 RepID=UPI002E1D4141|nr:hypothetical protein [Bacillus atrophaeus]